MTNLHFFKKVLFLCFIYCLNTAVFAQKDSSIANSNQIKNEAMEMRAKVNRYMMENLSVAQEGAKDLNNDGKFEQYFDSLFNMMIVQNAKIDEILDRLKLVDIKAKKVKSKRIKEEKITEKQNEESVIPTDSKDSISSEKNDLEKYIVKKGSKKKRTSAFNASNSENENENVGGSNSCSELNKSGQDKIHLLFSELYREAMEKKLVVIAYTDVKGYDKKELELVKQRSETVKSLLGKFGFDLSLIEISYNGKLIDKTAHSRNSWATLYINAADFNCN